MSTANLLQYGLFLLVVTLLVKPVGLYMMRVFEGEKTFLDRILTPIERRIYRLARIDSSKQMDWKQYAICFVIFGLVGTLFLYGLLRLQSFLPWFDSTYQNTPLSPDLSLNTAVSFATTTTWQAYGGETTMSYFSQLVGLVGQNFLAGAAGLAIGIAFIRGFSRQSTDKLGNFWVDLVRGILWILLPLSLIGSVALIWQGVPMNFNSYTQATTLEGGNQVIAQGPVAALEFIKNLGTNGGGFFNVNGAHPYENPTPLSNFLEMLAIAVLPAAFTYTFGRMVGSTRQGWVLFVTMVVLFAAGLGIAGWAEQSGNPQVYNQTAIMTNATGTQPGGNMEGKEVRFGIGGSVLAAVTTSNGATGSYNSMHDSYTPVGGMVPFANMLLGEMIFGGLGTGLYSMIIIALLGLFVCGLMIGRTPEYQGKKIDPPEMKVIMVYTLLGPLAILIPGALALITTWGQSGLTTNTTFHGFSEILFGYTSAFANNGQNFAGLNANNAFYNISLIFSMMVGRYGLGISALALAGLLAKKQRRVLTTAALPTGGGLFAGIIIFSAIVIGGLTYFPMLSLGPIVEHFIMVKP